MNAVSGISSMACIFQAFGVSLMLSLDRESDGVISFMNGKCCRSQNRSVSQDIGHPR